MKALLELFKKSLLCLLLLTLPTQLGKHFWPEWSFLGGMRIDYLSPTLYLTDLIFLGLLTTDLVEKVIDLKKNKLKFKFGFIEALGLGVIIINILGSQLPWAALIKWLRWGQIVWLIWFLKKERRFLKKPMSLILIVWILFETGLGVAQLAKGGSIEGLMYFLGERRFNLNTIGIASMSVFGQGILRAYGTFSHPNSLAGFLLVCVIWWIKERKRFDKNIVWWWVVFWGGIIGIIISGSRTIWLLGGVMMVGLLYFLTKKSKVAIGVAMIFLGILAGMLALYSRNYRLSDYIGGWDSESLEKRVQLNLVSFRMIKDNWWLGVGANNFLAELVNYQNENRFYWMQPVHNIGLLLWSEIGLLGLSVMGWWLYKLNVFKRKMGIVKISILLAILLSGLVDHYWVTLNQNTLLMAIVLALV